MSDFKSPPRFYTSGETEKGQQSEINKNGYFYVDSDEAAITHSQDKLSIFSGKAAVVTAGRYADVSVFLGGNGNSEIFLNNIEKGVIRTQDGNDYIEVSSRDSVRAHSPISIYTNLGHDLVIINANTPYELSYRVFTGAGDDKVITKGAGRSIIDTGSGDDQITLGEGEHVILAGSGNDEVFFGYSKEAYNIRQTEENRIEVTYQEENGNLGPINTLVDVERISFMGETLDFAEKSNLHLDSATTPSNFWYTWHSPITNTVSLDQLRSYFTSLAKSIFQDNHHENGHTNATQLEKHPAQETSSPENSESEVTPISKPIMEVQSVSLEEKDIPEAPFDLDLVYSEYHVMEGGKKSDFIIGGSKDDLILAHSGSDYLLGLSGNDVMVGGQGNDYFEGGAGDDILIGGQGEDTAFYAGFADEFVLDLSNNTITDLLLDYGRDTLVSIEKVSFFDATYKIKNGNVEKIDSGFFNFWWTNDDGLHVTGQNNVKEEPTSYQINLDMDDHHKILEIEL